MTSSISFRRLIEWFACARLSESHLPRSYAVTFPKRSLPWLFTNAALGGLKPAPASRLRGALPHLLCSYAHFILKCARGALKFGYHTVFRVDKCLKQIASMEACRGPLRLEWHGERRRDSRILEAVIAARNLHHFID